MSSMPPWMQQLLPILILLAAISLVILRLPKVELGHSEAIKEAVAASLGVSILSELTVQREIAWGMLVKVPIEGITLTRWFLLAQRRRYRPSAAGQAFLDLLPGN